MTPEDVRTLYAFNAWANHRVLDSCQPLSTEQFTRALGSSFTSVRDTLAHIMGCEWLYFERWHGRFPTALLPGETFADLASVRARWQKIESDLLGYVNGPGLGDLARVFAYRNMRGNQFAYPLQAMLQHMVNHSTYHRGQVTTLLRQLGAQPRATDLLRYYDFLAGEPED
jgi:uncharacterized damage-inducible protein DinB